MKNTSNLPTDYEACGTCGYDHTYDFPYLTVQQRAQMIDLHLEDVLAMIAADRKNPKAR